MRECIQPNSLCKQNQIGCRLCCEHLLPLAHMIWGGSFIATPTLYTHLCQWFWPLGLRKICKQSVSKVQIVLQNRTLDSLSLLKSTNEKAKPKGMGWKTLGVGMSQWIQWQRSRSLWILSGSFKGQRDVYTVYVSFGCVFYKEI